MEDTLATCASVSSPSTKKVCGSLALKSPFFPPSSGHQIFFKHGVRLVEAAEIQLESQGRPATYAVFILPYL